MVRVGLFNARLRLIADIGAAGARAAIKSCGCAAALPCRSQSQMRPLVLWSLHSIADLLAYIIAQQDDRVGVKSSEVARAHVPNQPDLCAVTCGT